MGGCLTLQVIGSVIHGPKTGKKNSLAIFNIKE